MREAREGLHQGLAVVHLLLETSDDRGVVIGDDEVVRGNIGDAVHTGLGSRSDHDRGGATRDLHDVSAVVEEEMMEGRRESRV